MSYQNTLDKLSTAVEDLIVGKGRIRERLKTAALKFHLLKEDDFPAELRAQFASLMQDLTNYITATPESTIIDTVDHLTEDKAAQCAATILKLQKDLYASTRDIIVKTK